MSFFFRGKILNQKCLPILFKFYPINLIIKKGSDICLKLILPRNRAFRSNEPYNSVRGVDNDDRANKRYRTLMNVCMLAMYTVIGAVFCCIIGPGLGIYTI